MLSDGNKKIMIRYKCNSLNPCSGGLCSLTLITTLQRNESNLVLILVLVDYALWLHRERVCRLTTQVLILVLVDYALWQQDANPPKGKARVLILVLVDYALWRNSKVESRSSQKVLILVLVDYALWLYVLYAKHKISKSLNPCSGGLCSLTRQKLKVMKLLRTS